MTVIRRRSKELEKYLKAGNKGRLLPAVERHLMTKPPEHRDHTYLHPSDLAKPDWCQRGAWYKIRLGNDEVRVESLRSQNVFDAGHEAHHRWQGRLAQMGNLYGKWRCATCGQDRGWGIPSEGLPGNVYCDLNCRANVIYDEVPLYNEDLRIRGHADGWVVGLGDDFLIEIKTIGTGTVRFEKPELLDQYGTDVQAMWKAIRRPFPSHLRQALLYTHLLQDGQAGRPGPKEIVFLYEWKLDQEPREFIVPYTTDLIEEALEGAARVAAALQTDKPPICPWGGCKQCRKWEQAA